MSVTLEITTRTDVSNPVVGDLFLSLTGQMRLTTEAGGIAQRIRSRLRMFRGSWFLDLRLGMPYFAILFKKQPSIELIRSAIREAILTTPGVVGVDVIEIAYNPSTRQAAVTWIARAKTGDIIQDRDFVIEVA